MPRNAISRNAIQRSAPALAALAALALAVTATSPAQAEGPGRAELVRQLDSVLPAVITEDNSVLVTRMLAAKFGKPISDNLDPAVSLRTVFGRRAPRLAPDCSRKTTEAGDPSQDECVASQGELAGDGAYVEFGWDRNLGFGNVHFLSRQADGSVKPGELSAVRINDADAWKKGTDFLVNTLGLPPEEFVPVAPGAKPDSLSVRTLLVGENTPDGLKTVVPVMKVVKFPRTVEIQLPDPTGKDVPKRIRAPGEAVAMLNDAGVVAARVTEWRALQRAPEVDPKNAKTRNELLAEIADAILATRPEGVDRMRAQLVIREPDPETGAANSPLRNSVHAIMPGVEVSIAPVARDPDEEAQSAAGPSTAGYTMQFALVHLPEETVANDD